MLKNLIQPYQFLKMKPYFFFIYFILIVILGHIGIILSFTEIDKTFFEHFKILIEQRTFFNMGISILASSIFPIILSFLIEEDAKFKGLKMSSVVLGLLIIIVYIILFFTLKKIDCLTTVIQSLFHIFTIMLSIYLFTLPFLDTEYEFFAQLDDSNKNSLIKKAEKKRATNG